MLQNETSVCACFLGCFLKDDPFFFQIVVQMVGWKLEQLELKGHKPTWSRPEMEMDLNC